MTLVLDASIVVAALVDAGPLRAWAEGTLVSEPLAAPQLMPAAAASILRRTALAGETSAEVAALTHDDLLALRVELFPYPPLASRVWELRANHTPYDGWYVALAETLDAELATLDVKLSRAPGPRCAFATPPPLARGRRGPLDAQSDR